MRQRTSAEKVQRLLSFYAGLKRKFNAGMLDGKISLLINSEAASLGISRATAWRKIKDHEDQLRIIENGKYVEN